MNQETNRLGKGLSALISTDSYANSSSYIEKFDIEKISAIVNEMEKDGYDFTSFVNKFVKLLREKAIFVKKKEINSKMNFTNFMPQVFAFRKAKTEFSINKNRELKAADHSRNQPDYIYNIVIENF